eukprot:CAMPEP_0197241340 /NCGR_PEP_ID=MMETSP1429-20130617/7401_1 /TAXON_ID=49237 /ORGANISM="Chaetoceros  sp., Strain UNC1202" /LENGTH=91 /DNA_ID=CAMNT_0042701161 /DNA_START=373 /DNA_END=648 /DNA_ORIENTATION=+
MSSVSSKPTEKDEPYKCSIDIQFLTRLHAQNAMDVLSVDKEIGDRVTKILAVKGNIMVVNVSSSEAKMLRVAISSFYDMLSVFLKCYQEFG